MVRLHMIDNQVVYRPVPYGFLYIGNELFFEAALNGIDKSNLLICNDI